jgi:hypothetical protein
LYVSKPRAARSFEAPPIHLQRLVANSSALHRTNKNSNIPANNAASEFGNGGT